jgi:predicted transposase YbfD/YdcC
VDSGNEYVIQVKSNQIKLFSGVEKIIRRTVTIDECVNKEVNKGRVENRGIRIYKHDERYISKDWKNINRIVEVINTGIRGGNKYFEKHYYISSLVENNAEVFARGIREHWSIENKLHRVKDVVQNEDNSLIVDKRIAANLSLIKSITISLFRLNGYTSIKRALERFTNRISDCGDLIGIKPI